MPVWNASDTVAAAIASVQAQTLRDWELLAVDDGSDDGSAALLAAAAATDARIRVLHRPHAGIVAALNAGIAAARAPFIARLDADDICLPERLERQLARLVAEPELGLVGCRVRYGGDRESQAGYAAYVDWTNSLVTAEQIDHERFVESPFAHPSVMFRADLLAAHGGYTDGEFPEDYELWLRWLDTGVRMAKVDAELLIWQDPPGRLSRTDPRYSVDAFHALKARYLAAWLARHNPQHPAVWIWGAGRITRKRAEHLVDHGVRIVGYVDIDPKKIGQIIHGRPVVGPDDLPPPAAAFILPYVANRGARELIAARLAAAGFTIGTNYLPAG